MATRTKAKKTNTKASKTRAKSASKGATRRSAAKPARAAAAKPKTSGLQLTEGAPSITVNDVAATLAWYCDVLGFAVKQRWEHEGVLRGAELRAGGVTVYVGQDDWKKGRDRVKGEGLRLYWYTNQNIDKLAAAIKSRGGTLESEPRDEYGARSFGLVDPTGYKITISSER
jgi:uncharacterized glyoxalase superfamily protein PhnB